MSRVWLKLDATYPEDDRILEAGALAELLFVRSIAYCRRRLTDGFVSKSAVKLLALGIPDAAETLVEALVANELWLVVDGGWKVRSYEKWQQTKADLAADAERKRTERDREKERKKERDIGGTSASCPPDIRLVPDFDEPNDTPTPTVADLKAMLKAKAGSA